MLQFACGVQMVDERIQRLPSGRAGASTVGPSSGLRLHPYFCPLCSRSAQHSKGKFNESSTAPDRGCKSVGLLAGWLSWVGFRKVGAVHCNRLSSRLARQ